MSEANFENDSRCAPQEPLAGADEAPDRWRHDIRAVDPEHRVWLTGVAQPGDVLHGCVADGCWVLRPAANGQVIDGRARLLIPVGVRYLASFDRRVGVSWRPGAVVLWPLAVADRLVEHLA